MRNKLLIVGAVAAGSLLLLWLCCLPCNLFDGVAYSTVVVDAKGELLGARVADDGQWRFPPCDTLPEKFVEALVEFEDHRFFAHCGVSVPALLRATSQNLRNGRVVSGGSTITMQLIRLSRRKPRTLWQKVVEIFMATRLEMRYTKEQILTLYASHAPFGGNVVGIRAALWRYLGNEEVELSWAEAATLAVLQNAPSLIRPDRNREALRAKRNRLLARLHQKGVIAEEDYRLAIEEPLIGKPCPMPQYAPHLVAWQDGLHPGKLIKTHIDLALQQRVEELTSRWNCELRRSGIRDLAAVIVEVKSGEIIAYCGNADLSFEREGRWVDIARSPRSSGSILKPLLYAAALQEGVILPKQLLPDVPTDFGGFAPKNFDGSYLGALPADEALALSLNVPYVHLLQTYGISRFAETLKACGLSSLSRPSDQYGLSLVLGGAEVSLLDVVTCYARMAACYTDSTAFATFPLRDRIALGATFDAMREVNRPDQLDWRRVASIQHVAWKTGTSYGSRDAWAIGLTPKYVVGVWAGNADGSGVSELTGARTAGPLLFDLIGLLPHSEWFDHSLQRGEVVQKVCRHSGHLAGRYCVETDLLQLPKRSSKAPICPYCKAISVSTDGLKVVSDRSEPTRKEHFFLLPPHMAYYYKVAHPEYRSLPELKPSLLEPMTSSFRFIYPSDNCVVSLPLQMDGTKGQLVCKVAHSDPSAELFWHLDDLFLGSTTDLHHQPIQPSPGYHTLTVVDHLGARQTLRIIVR